MKTFFYKAINKNDVIINGRSIAKSELHLAHQLENVGLELIRTRPALNINIGSREKKPPLRDLLTLFIQLERMDRSGIPILESLKSSYVNSTNSILADILMAMHIDVSDGLSLSESMKKHPKTFNNLSIAIVSSAEQTGKLADAFLYLVDYFKWLEKMRSRIKKATRYPMVVIGVVFIGIVVMMGLVVPKITEFLLKIDPTTPLPFATRSLIYTSNFFQEQWLLVFLIPMVFIFGLVISCEVSYAARYKVNKLILKLPVVGQLIRKLEIARFAQVTAALYTSKIPILESLQEAEKTVNNLVLKQSIGSIIKDVEEGVSISIAFQNTGEFLPMVIQMVAIGEETGKLASLLEEVSEFYSADIDNTLDSMIAMIEPGLTAILGGFVLWIAAGVFGPIYGMFGNLM